MDLMILRETQCEVARMRPSVGIGPDFDSPDVSTKSVSNSLIGSQLEICLNS